MKSDLPQALEILRKCSNGEQVLNRLTAYVTKARIAENGDYNLSKDCYRISVYYSNTRWPIMELGELCDITAGQSPEGKYYNDNGEGLPFYQGKTEFTEEYIGEPRYWTTKITKIADRHDILMSVRAPVGPVNIATQKICIGRGLASIRPTKADTFYIFALLRSVFTAGMSLSRMQDSIKGNAGATFDSINRSDIAKIKLPVPPPEIQEQIVSELSGYQRIISGAKQIAANWKPQIDIDPRWDKVRLCDVCERIMDGTHYSPDNADRGDAVYISAKNIKEDGLDLSKLTYISKKDHEDIYRKCPVKKGDVLYIKDGATQELPQLTHSITNFLFFRVLQFCEVEASVCSINTYVIT